jgi:phage baseplate assembly protein W
VTPGLMGLIIQAVQQALGQWEPRVDIEEVNPVQDDDDDALVRVYIRYRVRATNDRRNLVYPFYVIPHESE